MFLMFLILIFTSIVLLYLLGFLALTNVHLSARKPGTELQLEFQVSGIGLWDMRQVFWFSVCSSLFFQTIFAVWGFLLKFVERKYQMTAPYGTLFLMLYCLTHDWLDYGPTSSLLRFVFFFFSNIKSYYLSINILIMAIN